MKKISSMWKCVAILMGLFSTGIFGFYFGKACSYPDLRKKEIWASLSEEDARNTLSFHLDVSNVPHGDLVVSSQKVHSGRYIVSQWQRVAAGAVVVVLGRDKDQDLCIAMGPQRGKLVPPQGYMEAKLPKNDLTGLHDKGASRINAKTGEIVYADATIEDNAVREVKEELGIDISKNDLLLLGISSGEEENSVVPTIVGKYGILLPQTPQLKTLDTEFINDDMQDPFWVKAKEIKCEKGVYHTPNHSFPIDFRNIKIIKEAILKLSASKDLQDCADFLSFFS